MSKIYTQKGMQPQKKATSNSMRRLTSGQNLFEGAKRLKPAVNSATHSRKNSKAADSQKSI